ncbi:LysR family transcriptional regulator [Nodosilinea sp. LEGE 07088]|uniref:LysR family transcriptional regulator n=1 Tax=Nodosilinea sp. LEGE 07088 TaxID=2777968 RepID=UPI00187DEDD8|nr:LysR family transcriptional regulator [Nodosilinea sp. LEGE 07088]MBE9138487.1 LysR family transcriptional regulator [Nodosilinea sp. LEGE 07088]
MNLAGWDLNLLVVFDALMAERHVTRAGDRIGLSQPATSNALARLRKLTKDELFIRAGGALQPTPVAIALAQQIQPALQQIDQALMAEPPFDPAQSDRVFAVGMSDYTSFVLLPRLLQAIAVEAPQVAIQVRSGERAKLLGLLDAGEVDVVCGVFPNHVPWHHCQQLFAERFVCVCRQGHPFMGGQVSLQDYVRASHLLVSIAEDRVGRIDHLLKQQKLSRHVALSVPHILVAPFVLAQTDLIATLSERVARRFAHTQALQILPLPLPLKGFSVVMKWHQSSHEQADQVWLRSRLQAISEAL